MSARVAIFREIFEVSQRHAGYVDLQYFLGLWHHLCEERPSRLPRAPPSPEESAEFSAASSPHPL